MNRKYFIKLAGGIPQVPQKNNYVAQKIQQKYFWRFFSQSKWRKSVKAIYSDQTVDTLLRKGTYSIEHILPKSHLRYYLKAIHQPSGLVHSAIYNPFNYAPSHRRVNASRSSLPFDLDNEDIFTFIQTKKTVNSVVGVDQEGEWVVPERSRGTVARAVLYMSILYGIDQINRHPVDEYLTWALECQPELWEIEFNRWMRKKYKISNPYIEKCQGITPQVLCHDAELMQSLHFFCAQRKKENHEDH